MASHEAVRMRAVKNRRAKTNGEYFREGRINRYARNDRNTPAVSEPPESGGGQLIATDQAAPNGNNSVAPDGG
jgi:hypothetical protein